MTRIVSVAVEDQTGQLGRLARVLAEGGVNIDVVSAHGGTLLLVVDDVAQALDRLRAAGHKPGVEEVLEVGLPNWPGELASLGEALGAAGVNITSVFGSTSDGRMYVRVDHPAKAKPVLARYGPVRIPADAIGLGRI